jgi:hypothetical protein
MNEDHGYRERYCAFVDILGFREIIATLEADPTKYREIRELLREIHVPPRTNDEILKGSDLRAQSISDAVAISTDCSPPGLLHLLFLLEHLATDVLNKGFLIRGAIVKGRLYHDDSMVFGEALVRAAHLEQEIVRFPRIMIATTLPATWRFTAMEVNRSHFVDALRQADDGPMYLHVLRFPAKAISDELKRHPGILRQNLLSSSTTQKWERNYRDG